MLLFGDQIRFKINSWQPRSNRIYRDYKTDVKEYRSYNENKTVRLILRGLQEKYIIELYDWNDADLAVFDALETSTAKNLCNFQPSLDSDIVKLSYFEYYIDPFETVLKIEITPVFLLQYSTLGNSASYSVPVQEFGNTIDKTRIKIGGVTLPVETSCKISVDYDTTEKISITGKIHREYFYQQGKVYKKIKLSGSSLNIDNSLYGLLQPIQGGNNVKFDANGFNYECAVVFDFVRYLKNKWILNFNCEVQREYEPTNIFIFGHITTPAPIMPENCIFIFGEI